MRFTRKKLLILVVLFVAVPLFFVLRSGSYWNGTSRFRLLMGSADGNVSFFLFDPKKGDINLYELNGKTQIETAYGMGEWKIESLWKLGEQEKRGGGDMLARSVTRGLYLPVEGYVRGSSQTSSFALSRALLFHEGNVTAIDRLKLVWFTLRSKIETKGVLTQQAIVLTGEELTTLTDGIVTISASNALSDTQLRALSSVVSNLGGKVLDVSTSNFTGTCEVKGTSAFAHKLAGIFGCTEGPSEDKAVTLVIGDEFAKIF